MKDSRALLKTASKALKDQRVCKVRPGRRALLEPLARRVSGVLRALWVLLVLKGLLVQWVLRVPPALKGRRGFKDRLGLKGPSVLLDLRAPSVRLERLGKEGRLDLPDRHRS